jgi:hypothetical protein
MSPMQFKSNLRFNLVGDCIQTEWLPHSCDFHVLSRPLPMRARDRCFHEIKALPPAEGVLK